jgi:hypothetical protein
LLAENAQIKFLRSLKKEARVINTLSNDSKFIKSIFYINKYYYLSYIILKINGQQKHH